MLEGRNERMIRRMKSEREELFKPTTITHIPKKNK